MLFFIICFFFCSLSFCKLNVLVTSLTDTQSSDGLRKTSFNGELNGLLGAGLLGATDRSTMSESSRPISNDISIAQETQTM